MDGRQGSSGPAGPGAEHAEHARRCTALAYLELLVVVPVVDHHKAKVKAAAEIKEVVSFCFRPSVVVKIELVLLL